MKYFIILLTISTICYSQNQRIDRFFEINDSNNDGKVTTEELNDANAFDILDKNGDGVITRNELDPNAPVSEVPKEKERKNKKRKILNQFDANSDGKISREEWPGNKGTFDNLDVDNDGFLIKNELPNRKAFKQMQKGPQRQNITKRLDQDGDGEISEKEWRGPQRIFNHLDKDGNKSLSADELPKGKNQGKHRGKGLKMLKQMDKNQDKRISKDEWTRNAKAFERMDQNKDGFLDREDLNKGKKPHQKLQKFLKRMDKNQDEKIDASEWMGNIEKFRKLDVDGNGFLTKEEIQKQVRKMKQGGQEGFREKMRNRFKMLDSDNDGKISQDEWPGKLERFQKMDRNKDGFISKEDRNQK